MSPGDSRGYSSSVMATALGLFGIVAFVACVIAFAAAMTWLVVKLSPAGARKPSLDRGER